MITFFFFTFWIWSNFGFLLLVFAVVVCVFFSFFHTDFLGGCLPSRLRWRCWKVLDNLIRQTKSRMFINYNHIYIYMHILILYTYIHLSQHSWNCLSPFKNLPFKLALNFGVFSAPHGVASRVRKAFSTTNLWWAPRLVRQQVADFLLRSSLAKTGNSTMLWKWYRGFFVKNSWRKSMLQPWHIYIYIHIYTW